MKARVIAWLVIAMAVAVTAQGPAKSPAAIPRTADGKPNFNGIWQAMNTANWDVEAHAAGPSLVRELGAITAVPGGLGIVEGGEIPYRPEALATRFEAYRNQTAPILPYYRARGILRPVDGMADIDQVTRQIEAVLRNGAARQAVP